MDIIRCKPTSTEVNMLVPLAPLQWLSVLSRKWCGRDELVLVAVVRPNSDLKPEDLTRGEYYPVYVRELSSSTTPRPQKLRVKRRCLWFAPPFLTTDRMYEVCDGDARVFVPPATGLYAFLKLPETYGNAPRVAAYIPAINTAQLEATVQGEDPVVMFAAVEGLGEALEDKKVSRSAVVLTFRRKKRTVVEVARYPVRGCSGTALYALTVDPSTVAVGKDGNTHVTLDDPVVRLLKSAEGDDGQSKGGLSKKDHSSRQTWPLQFRTLRTRVPEGSVYYYVPEELVAKVDTTSLLYAMKAVMNAASIPPPEGSFYFSKSSTGSKLEDLYGATVRTVVFAARRAMEEDIIAWKLKEVYEPAVACEKVEVCFRRTKYAVKNNRPDWLVKVSNTPFCPADPHVVLATRAGTAFVRVIADVWKDVEPTPLYIESLEPVVELMSTLRRAGYLKEKKSGLEGVYVKRLSYKESFSAVDELKAPPCRYSPWVVSDPLYFRDSELAKKVLSFHILLRITVYSAPLDVALELAYQPVTGVHVVE